MEMEIHLATGVQNNFGILGFGCIIFLWCVWYGGGAIQSDREISGEPTLCIINSRSFSCTKGANITKAPMRNYILPMHILIFL